MILKEVAYMKCVSLRSTMITELMEEKRSGSTFRNITFMEVFV